MMITFWSFADKSTNNGYNNNVTLEKDELQARYDNLTLNFQKMNDTLTQKIKQLNRAGKGSCSDTGERALTSPSYDEKCFLLRFFTDKNKN